MSSIASSKSGQTLCGCSRCASRKGPGSFDGEVAGLGDSLFIRFAPGDMPHRRAENIEPGSRA
jgi:hypothetical protein